MKYGIDSYCYHRFFGEVYDGQETPEKQMTVAGLLERAKQMGAEGLSLETCFLPSDEDTYFADLGAEMDRYNFYRVLAWGHPTGLERGKKPEALDELIRYIPKAKRMKADIMRITASCYLWRFEDHQQQIEAVIPLLKKAVKVAEDNDVKLAMETHMDFTAPEMKTIIDRIGSPNFGVTFDSGNLLRMLQDPIAGMELLAPYVFATHIKDVVVDTAFSAAHHCFFSCVPVGWGLVDNARLAEILSRHNYDGMLAVEIDQPTSQWEGIEDEAVAISVYELRKLAEKYS
jgi:sugar phosphate isomerase/epimerase